MLFRAVILSCFFYSWPLHALVATSLKDPAKAPSVKTPYVAVRLHALRAAQTVFTFEYSSGRCLLLLEEIFFLERFFGVIWQVILFAARGKISSSLLKERMP